LTPARFRGASEVAKGTRSKEHVMSVAKVVEICAASPTSIEDAVAKGVQRASDTIEHVEGAWVQDIKVEVDKGKIVEWRVNLKVTFVLN
jgi:flavin-binding protein dodecin